MKRALQLSNLIARKPTRTAGDNTTKESARERAASVKRLHQWYRVEKPHISRRGDLCPRHGCETTPDGRLSTLSTCDLCWAEGVAWTKRWEGTLQARREGLVPGFVGNLRLMVGGAKAREE